MGKSSNIFVKRLLKPMTTRMATTLGRYEIESEIGRGAMGIVYRALDPKIDRFVAIKTISMFGQEPDEEQSFRERFLGKHVRPDHSAIPVL